MFPIAFLLILSKIEDFCFLLNYSVTSVAQIGKEVRRFQGTVVVFCCSLFYEMFLKRDVQPIEGVWDTKF